ncbi:long-chain-fatty-acid--CoA ligase [Pimelobacter sp. 30-1]|uniref:long-chain-fatty-acid--CoA ligase n=1 Tax=Pimelobacter sp. 30-1 TaxID=2004991 RepID=UPI00207BAEE5|nr:long-chain-fatty-acid--CoA ligase [Pimelobacter sp. 30-1]MBU2693680.1 hypothetical protein [Pimelobacter sp. 30-1]
MISTTMGHGDLTIARLLEHGARWHADREVVVAGGAGEPDITLTFAEVAAGAARLAHALAGLGVTPGTAVGTLLWNDRAHLEAYLAVPAMGAVLHTANPRLSAAQLRHTLAAAHDRVLLVAADLVDQVRPLLADLPEVEHVVVVGGPDDAYDALVSGRPATYPWPEVAEDTAASICFTTGTTGDPKGVVYSHRSILLQCLSAASTNALRLGSEDRLLVVVPMFHATAWCYPYAAWWFGADLVLPGRVPPPEEMVALLRRQRVTFANGVPAVWSEVARALDVDPEPLPHLRQVVIGGAAVSAALLDAFDRHGITVLQGWGMTETSPLVTVGRPLPGTTPAEERSARLSQGRLLAGVDLRLVDPDTGTELPCDGTTVGEIEVRGPWVTASYLDGAGADRFHDGWLRTGDVGTVDPRGYLRLTDRAKDVIKSGGEWISSVELENLISGLPGVAEAAVIGVPDERWDERPLAVVTGAGAGLDLDLPALRAAVAEQVPRWWVPERWAVVDVLPHTSVGKLDKVALRRAHAAGELAVRTP